MALRPAAAADRSAISNVLRTAELPHEDLHRSDLEHFFVIDGEGGVRGVVGLELLPPYGLLRSLAVAPDLRGRGYGRALVDRAERYGHAQTLEALYLLTTTANVFFARLGYDETDREDAPTAVGSTEEFRRLCPAIAVCMWKPLTADASSARRQRSGSRRDVLPSEVDQSGSP